MNINTENLDNLINDIKSETNWFYSERGRKALEEFKKLKSADFWSNWVYPEGANPEEIQNELLDYREYLKETAKVYDAITNGRISKVNTKSEDVISVAEDILQENIKDRLNEIFTEIKENYLDA